MSVAVYIYHDIGSSYYKPTPPDLLREDLARLAWWGRRVMTFGELLFGGVPEEEAVILSFDDGLVSHLEVAAPLLEEFGVRGSFSVSTAPPEPKAYMTHEQVRRLAARHEVVSHGHEHRPAMSHRLWVSEAVREIIESRRILAEWGVPTPQVYVAPQGQMTNELRLAAVTAGIRAIRTTRWGVIERDTDFLSLPGMESIPR